MIVRFTQYTLGVNRQHDVYEDWYRTRGQSNIQLIILVARIVFIFQTPVSSLEQLARQSRINYTVVEGSSVHQYFINMKFAEDTLYR